VELPRHLLSVLTATCTVLVYYSERQTTTSLAARGETEIRMQRPWRDAACGCKRSSPMRSTTSLSTCCPLSRNSAEFWMNGPLGLLLNGFSSPKAFQIIYFCCRKYLSGIWMLMFNPSPPQCQGKINKWWMCGVPAEDHPYATVRVNFVISMPKYLQV
jgi:hypothetical protein